MQEKIRQRFIWYLNQTGAKQKHVSINTKITTDVLSRFKHGKDLLNSSLNDLDKYLTKQGY